MRSNPGKPLVGIGEVLWDLLPGGPRLGGTTTNFAVLSARLGECVALVTRVGEDELGREAMQRLGAVLGGEAAGFDLSHVQHSSELATGTVSVTLDAEGRPRYNIHQPVAWDAMEMRADLRELAQAASGVCFGTLAQREPRSRAAVRAFVESTAPGCVRVCDINLREPFCTAEVLHWCLAQATVLKVSDEELGAVGRLLEDPVIAAGIPEDSEAAVTEAATQAAQALLRRAPRCQLVAITLGPRGSLLADRRGIHRHTGFAVTVADTIGAGDAFTAGLVHAYVRSATLAQINEVSNLCGSYVASQPGATPELPLTLVAQIAEALQPPPKASPTT